MLKEIVTLLLRLAAFPLLVVGIILCLVGEFLMLFPLFVVSLRDYNDTTTLTHRQKYTHEFVKNYNKIVKFK